MVNQRQGVDLACSWFHQVNHVKETLPDVLNCSIEVFHLVLFESLFDLQKELENNRDIFDQLSVLID